jgi:hypothetical protein
MRARCQPSRYCEIYVEDRKFRDLERRWQEEPDAKARAKNAPAAPKL